MDEMMARWMDGGWESRKKSNMNTFSVILWVEIHAADLGWTFDLNFPQIAENQANMWKEWKDPDQKNPSKKPYTQTRDLYTWNSHLFLMFHSLVSVGVLCNQPHRPQSWADGVTIQIIPKDAFGESSDFGHTECSPYFQQIFLHVPLFWPVTLKAALILSAPDQWNYMTNV